MIKVRASNERGHENKGWLNTYHTFSFDTYYDPQFMRYRDLRVLNEDTVIGGKGFGSHSHKDMEIITYVIEGTLEHQDSMGRTTIIRPHEVQCMSAGSGILHSEYNLSHHEPVHFLQIWITPDQNNLEPRYAQKLFSPAAKWGQWCLIGSRNGRDGSIRIHQNVDLWATGLEDNDSLIFESFIGRYYWMQIISGKFLVQETILNQGDGAMIEDESTLEIRCLSAGELLLFDLA